MPRYGIGIYVFDSEHQLYLVRKSDSKIGDSNTWLVPGTTFDDPWDCYSDEFRDNKIYDILKEESPIPERILLNREYSIKCLGSWCHRKDKQDYIFINYVAHLTSDGFRHLPEKGRIKKPNIEGTSFNLLSLPISKMSELTQDFFKSSLFHSSGYIPQLHDKNYDEFKEYLGNDHKKYFYLDNIGGGGYGRVYVTLDIATLLPRVVKIPLVNDHDINWPERFLLEGKALFSLNHHKVENVEEIYSINRAVDGRYYLLKEYIKGKNLLKCDNYKKEHVVDIISEIVKVLAKVHSLKVCHRDIKPNNIMIETFDDNKPKITLIDFGLVKSFQIEVGMDPNMTNERFRTGSASYQSLITYNSYKNHNYLDDYYSVLHTFYWLVNNKNFYEDYFEVDYRFAAKKAADCKSEFTDPFLDECILNKVCENWKDKSCLPIFKEFHTIIVNAYDDIYENTGRSIKVKNKKQLAIILEQVETKLKELFK